MSKEDLNPGAGAERKVRLVRDDSAEMGLISGEANFVELCADLDALGREEGAKLHITAARRIAADAAQAAREQSQTASGESLQFALERAKREPGPTLKFAARFGMGLRLAAALGLMAALVLVYIAQSRSGGSRTTPGGSAEVAQSRQAQPGNALQPHSGSEAPRETSQQLALRAAVEQFAAVSELYDDSLNEELDALAMRATSLGSWTIEGESPSEILGGYGGGM